MVDHSLLADKIMEDLKGSSLFPTDLVFPVWFLTMERVLFLITINNLH
jgi:hypothetical protein